MTAEITITIGELARRSGAAASALRFYEAQGLIAAERTMGKQRRFPRSTLRRVGFIHAAQRIGFSLEEIKQALHKLPDKRTPTKADWQAISGTWTSRLDARIAELERLKTVLNGCIGCGCLSLQVCALYNAGDGAAKKGPGARYLLGDRPKTRR